MATSVPTGSKSIVRILVKPAEFLCPTFISREISSLTFALEVQSGSSIDGVGFMQRRRLVFMKGAEEREQSNCRLVEGMRPKQNSNRTLLPLTRLAGVFERRSTSTTRPIFGNPEKVFEVHAPKLDDGGGGEAKPIDLVDGTCRSPGTIAN